MCIINNDRGFKNKNNIEVPKMCFNAIFKESLITILKIKTPYKEQNETMRIQAFHLCFKVDHPGL